MYLLGGVQRNGWWCKRKILQIAVGTTNTTTKVGMECKRVGFSVGTNASVRGFGRDGCR
jgi:hypothetical protein